MDHHMLCQMTVHVKRLSTYITFEYLIACVNLQAIQTMHFSAVRYVVNRYIFRALPFRGHLMSTGVKISCRTRCIETVSPPNVSEYDDGNCTHW